MKKYFILLISLISIAGIQAQNLNASLSYSRFYNPELGPYVETYLSVEAAGVQVVALEDGKYQAGVNLLLMFKRNDSIIDFSKTQLKSPLMDDTLHLDYSFLDQQRFFIPNGKYTLEIEFQDANIDKEPSKAKVEIDLNYTPENIQISDVEFLESYTKSSEWKINTKNGIDMVPRISSFFANVEEPMTYYAEIYQADKKLGSGEKFLFTAYISDTQNQDVVNNLIVRKKMDAQEVNVVLSKFDLSSLASGNYYLNIEAKNKNNELLAANKTFFQLSNPNISFDQALLAQLEAQNTFVDKFGNDSLNELIESVYPIASPTERAFIKNSLKDVDENQKRKFLLFFWQGKDAYHPEKAWQEYNIEVIKTNRSFGNKYTPGYATDRGRVYLQYGPPNTISDQEYEAGGGSHQGSVPYQIWHYYEVGNQRNGKFVFYNPHLVPNGYTLLHSNVIGEISNPHWQSYLHRDQLETIDPPNNDRYYGRSGELYNDPR